MKFETLKRYDIRNMIIILLVIILLLTTILFLVTRAKYKLVESRKLASGTINYTLVDFELVEIKYKASGNENYVDVDTIESNYEFNQDMSYCTEKYSDDSNNFRDVENEELTINFDKETKTISVSPYSKKGTKCHLYFDEKELPLLSEAIITLSTEKSGTFTGTSCNSGCDLTENGIYEAEDDYGTSYYYRGTVDNNWLVFGQDNSGNYIWWRIIRVNGNGTIRLIYAGTSTDTKIAPSTNGSTTMITPRTNVGGSSYPWAVKFNELFNDNKYVGYMYNDTPMTSSTFDEAHKVNSSSTMSTILEEIENWYKNDTNLSTLADKIDVDTGFCSDSSLAKGYTSKGYGNDVTEYAGTDRVWLADSTSWNLGVQTPTLKCGTDDTSRKRDLYTGPGATKGINGKVEGNNALPVPVGLITMDEVIYAGGFGGKTNTSYWLCTKSGYWTMTPFRFYSNVARVSFVQNDGRIDNNSITTTNYGVRPVINLKADSKFEIGGEGKSDNPYVIS